MNSIANLITQKFNEFSSVPGSAEAQEKERNNEAWQEEERQRNEKYDNVDTGILFGNSDAKTEETAETEEYDNVDTGILFGESASELGGGHRSRRAKRGKKNKHQENKPERLKRKGHHGK